MNLGPYLLPRLTRQEVEEALVGPARLYGAEIEEPLVKRVLDDIRSYRDQLPLMQHAMRRVWASSPW